MAHSKSCNDAVSWEIKSQCVPVNLVGKEKTHTEQQHKQAKQELISDSFSLNEMKWGDRKVGLPTGFLQTTSKRFGLFAFLILPVE